MFQYEPGGGGQLKGRYILTNTRRDWNVNTTSQASDNKMATALIRNLLTADAAALLHSCNNGLTQTAGAVTPSLTVLQSDGQRRLFILYSCKRRRTKLCVFFVAFKMITWHLKRGGDFFWGGKFCFCLYKKKKKGNIFDIYGLNPTLFFASST